jgi:hypothetical protein
MFIAGIVCYIRDTLSEDHLKPFSINAINRHAESVYDPDTWQIYSTTDIWIQNSLALDDKYNYMDTPNKNSPCANPNTQVAQMRTPSFLNDTDSVSTF